MADIDVQRRAPAIWPWVAGLVVLALLVWLLAETLGDDDAPDRERVEQVGTQPAAPAGPGARLVSA